MTVKVRIIKAKLPSYWYAGKIGEEIIIDYTEENKEDSSFIVLHYGLKDSAYFIEKEDFEIISIDDVPIIQEPRKQNPTICALFKLSYGNPNYEFFAWWKEPPAINEILSITDIISSIIVGDLLDGKVVKDIYGNKYLFNFELAEGIGINQ